MKMAIKIISSSNPIMQRVIQKTANDIPSAFESIASHANRRGMRYGITMDSAGNSITGFYNESQILAFHFEKRRKNKKTQTRAHTIVNGYLIDRHASLQFNFKQHQRHFTLSITIPFDLKIKR